MGGPDQDSLCRANLATPTLVLRLNRFGVSGLGFRVATIRRHAERGTPSTRSCWWPGSRRQAIPTGATRATRAVLHRAVVSKLGFMAKAKAHRTKKRRIVVDALISRTTAVVFLDQAEPKRRPTLWQRRRPPRRMCSWLFIGLTRPCRY